MSRKIALILVSVFVLAVSAQQFRIDRHKYSLSDLARLGISLDNRRNFESFRLPNSSVPTQYSLFLDSNIHQDDFSYRGNVQIQITILENTKQLVLHSAGNDLADVRLYTANQLPVTLVNFELDDEKEFLVINTLSTLQSGTNYRLHIEFSGQLRNDQFGFHRLSYQAEDGTTRNIAVTQFETIFARRAFPCYDEPAIRATFDITISCGFSYKATSNMPISEISIQSDQKKLTRFQRTPRMPTYLVAFMITDFTSKRMVLKEPTPLTMEIFARPTAANELDLGLRTGAESIRAIEQHLAQVYQLPKLDQVAIPIMPFGAMENWGLVKYDERYLLVNDQTASNHQKEEVIITIVHEFVHQFFGNLVTPKWWTDIFLNEGFATLYEYYIGAEVAPGIRFKELFAVEALQLAMVIDASALSRPLSYYAETIVMELFDTISYKKGGSVLRMMSHALGERTFQRGVQRYLATHANSAVDANDLFESLQSAAYQDAVLPLSVSVGTIMSSWIYQAGYPVVTVERVPDSNEFIFRQEHFSENVTDHSRTWWIPVSYRLNSQATEDETRTVFWMPPGASQVLVEIDMLEEDYLLVNPHQTGYYRVNYDADLWKMLIQKLHEDHNSIPAVSRAQLLDDSTKLAQNGRLDFATSFEIYKYLQFEDNYIPWFAALSADNFQYINNGLVVDETAYQALQTFGQAITNTLMTSVGFEEVSGEPHEHQRLRSMAIEWSCRMGSEECRSKAREQMTADIEGTLELPSYLKFSIYCGGLMNAGQSEFDTVFQAFQRSDDPAERAMYISALGCNEDSGLLSDYLTVSLGLTPDVRLNGNEWALIIRSVYSRTHVGYEALRVWMGIHFLDISRWLAPRPEYNVITSDIIQRVANFGNYDELIALLEEFQSETRLSI